MLTISPLMRGCRVLRWREGNQNDRIRRENQKKIDKLMEYTKPLNPEACRGKCAEITLQIVNEHPGLIRVRGHYVCPIMERSFPHWWLKTESGFIIDPTSAQFLSNGTGEYAEHDEALQEPTGKCLNCGNYCYGINTACSETCQAILDKQYNPHPISKE